MIDFLSAIDAIFSEVPDCHENKSYISLMFGSLKEDFYHSSDDDEAYLWTKLSVIVNTYIITGNNYSEPWVQNILESQCIEKVDWEQGF